MNERTSVSESTADEERVEADRRHVPDRPATAEEDEAAERSRAQFADDAARVADHESEMTDIGARVKGEGAIE